MSNFSKIWPVGLTNGVSTLDHTELEQLDTNVSNTINASDGSTHAPTTKVTIGGAGIGGNLPNGEYWQFGADPSAKRQLVRLQWCQIHIAKLNNGSMVDGGINGFALNPVASLIIVPDSVPHGATLTLVKLKTRFAAGRASLPTTYPRMTIRRIDAATGLFNVYLKSTDAGLGVNETFAAPPVLATYNALGDSQVTYTPDQNNVFDRALYSYMVTLFDEEGGGAVSGNLFKQLEFTFTLTQHGIA